MKHFLETDPRQGHRPAPRSKILTLGTMSMEKLKNSKFHSLHEVDFRKPLRRFDNGMWTELADPTNELTAFLQNKISGTPPERLAQLLELGRGETAPSPQ